MFTQRLTSYCSDILWINFCHQWEKQTQSKQLKLVWSRSVPRIGTENFSGTERWDKVSWDYMFCVFIIKQRKIYATWNPFLRHWNQQHIQSIDNISPKKNNRYIKDGTKIFTTLHSISSIKFTWGQITKHHDRKYNLKMCL